MTTIDDDFGPRFRQEQREREAFLRNTRESIRTATATRQTIAAHHGSARDALNATLARLAVADALLKKEQERSVMLLCALESIRQLARMSPPGIKSIGKIAREVLRASGETATTTEED